jgi:hypothetical protein
MKLNDSNIQLFKELTLGPFVENLGDFWVMICLTNMSVLSEDKPLEK